VVHATELVLRTCSVVIDGSTAGDPSGGTVAV
jgi:hypothetical protein